MGTERQQLWVVAVRASAKAARATAKAKAKARERERAMAKAKAKARAREKMEGKGKEDPRSLSSLIVMRACSSPRARRTHCVPSTWYPASLSTERSASLSMARMEQRPSIASGILSVLRSRLLFLVA